MTKRSHRNRAADHSLAEKKLKQNEMELIAYFFSLSFTTLLSLSPLPDNNQLFIYVKLKIPQCAALKIVAAAAAAAATWDFEFQKFIYLSQTNRFLSTEIESDAEHSKSIWKKTCQTDDDDTIWTFIAAGSEPSIIIRYFIYLFILLNEFCFGFGRSVKIGRMNRILGCEYVWGDKIWCESGSIVFIFIFFETIFYRSKLSPWTSTSIWLSWRSQEREKKSTRKREWQVLFSIFCLARI